MTWHRSYHRLAPSRRQPPPAAASVAASAG